jgi:L-rhamnose mutarotase
MPVNRFAFKMRLRPDSAAAYKLIHDNIGPDMLDLIAKSGARNYTIFREGLDLFAYLEFDEELTPSDVSNPTLARWWKSLEPYMEYNDDGSPTMWPMEEMFHAE